MTNVFIDHIHYQSFICFNCKQDNNICKGSCFAGFYSVWCYFSSAEGNSDMEPCSYPA